MRGPLGAGRRGAAGLCLLVAGTLGCAGAPRPRHAEAAPGRPATAAPDYGALLDALTDLDALASFPEPAYRSGLQSSRDPRSVAPDAEGWFDNGDRGHFVREERHGERLESVLADVTGPGLLTRIWSANPAGTLRIYVDGEGEPAVQAPMRALLDGELASFPPPLAGVRARGHNLYLPLPFQRRCVVTTDAGQGMYYQVHYRRYTDAIELPSLSPALLSRERAAIAGTARRLASPPGVQARPGERVRRALLSSAAPSLLLKADPGGSAIREIVIGPAALDTLRGSGLRIEFDGSTPGVDAPLLAFFGVAPDPVASESLPLSVAADGTLTSRWVMPFARSARLTLRSAPAGTLPVSVRVAPRPFRAGRSMHFVAEHRDHPDLSTAEPFDLPFCHVRGKGVYVGNLLHVFNPVEGWWGEGDEKIYVDGERFPGQFGTGTEDYYGYAWCSTETFAHPFHGQSRADGPKNAGHVVNTRFHIPDPIPFERELRFDMEVRHWEKTRGLQLEVVNYYYIVPADL